MLKSTWLSHINQQKRHINYTIGTLEMCTVTVYACVFFKHIQLFNNFYN